MIWYISYLILTWKLSQIVTKIKLNICNFLWLIMYDMEFNEWIYFCAHINVKRVIYLWYFELSQQLNIWMTINISPLIAQFYTANIYCSILLSFFYSKCVFDTTQLMILGFSRFIWLKDNQFCSKYSRYCHIKPRLS